MNCKLISGRLKSRLSDVLICSRAAVGMNNHCLIEGRVRMTEKWGPVGEWVLVQKKRFEHASFCSP